MILISSVQAAGHFTGWVPQFWGQFSSMFLNNPEVGFNCIPSQFADGNKLGGAADSLEGKETLQRDPEQSPTARSLTSAGCCAWDGATLAVGTGGPCGSIPTQDSVISLFCCVLPLQIKLIIL